MRTFILKDFELSDDSAGCLLSHAYRLSVFAPLNVPGDTVNIHFRLSLCNRIDWAPPPRTLTNSSSLLLETRSSLCDRIVVGPRVVYRGLYTFCVSLREQNVPSLRKIIACSISDTAELPWLNAAPVKVSGLYDFHSLSLSVAFSFSFLSLLRSRKPWAGEWTAAHRLCVVPQGRGCCG